MTPTVKVILMWIGGLWALGAFLFVAAMCRAARRKTPEMDIEAQWRAQARAKRVMERRRKAEEIQALHG